MTTALAPDAWVLDDTGFPKFGRHLVGVAPQDCGTLGKVANCQVGVSVHAVTDRASCPLDWRLFLPQSWDDDAERRRTAHVPDSQRHRPKWQLALELLDELAGWELVPPVVLADAADGKVAQFRLGLEQRGLAYLVQVPATLSAHPEQLAPEQVPYGGRGRPPVARYRQRRSSLRQLVLAAGAQTARTVAWRQGTDGQPLGSRFVALRVRPAGARLRRAARGQGSELPVRWLLAEWPQGEPEPVADWLASLPADSSLARLVGLAKLRWRVEHDDRELKDALGLDHFEGRSFRGWHHHVTLVSVAHGFVTLERLDPKAAASG
jgi:SRSO17 transposase